MGLDVVGGVLGTLGAKADNEWNQVHLRRNGYLPAQEASTHSTRRCMNYTIQGQTLPTWSSCSLSLRYSLQVPGEAAAFTASLTGCECLPMTISLSQPLRG